MGEIKNRQKYNFFFDEKGMKSCRKVIKVLEAVCHVAVSVLWPKNCFANCEFTKFQEDYDAKNGSTKREFTIELCVLWKKNCRFTFLCVET